MPALGAVALSTLHENSFKKLILVFPEHSRRLSMKTLDVIMYEKSIQKFSRLLFISRIIW